MQNSLLIGIDGGGTHSTAVAAYPDGRIAAVTEGGGLNFHTSGVDAVRSRMESMVEALCHRCGAKAAQVCVGTAALDAPADEATLARFCGGLFSKEQLDLQSDAYIALMGFTMGNPGVIVICGTGSMLLMLDDKGDQRVAGGWGYLLGDFGSGYALAHDGLLAVIDASEGIGPKTAISADALQYFGAAAPRLIIDRIYAPDTTPADIAGFARYVLTRAQENDAVAYEIVSRNMKRLALSAAKLIESAPKANRVGLYGGIFRHSDLARGIFSKSLQSLSPGAVICNPDYPPELGALIHLFKKNGTLTDEVLIRMKSTYQEVLHERN